MSLLRRKLIPAMVSVAALLAAGTAFAQGSAAPSARFRCPQGQVPGKNAVTNLVVKQGRFQTWTADFDYFFTGDPCSAELILELTPEHAAPLDARFANPYVNQISLTERGAHHVSALIHYPLSAQRTTRVNVLMRGYRPVTDEQQAVVPARLVQVTLDSQEVARTIDWPDPVTASRNENLAAHSPEENLKAAVAQIDINNDVNELYARAILEGLIAENPRMDAAYVELARVAMKTNWGPEGLHHAEGLLQSALQINPQSTDAKILLGYVYTHQKRYDKAETAFADAAAANSSNLWLWSNWGELREMEGKPDEAIAMYRKTIAHPMSHDSHDQARTFAYRKLIAALETRSDLDGAEALYEQQVDEFGPGSCYSADYSRFLLDVRGNAQAAIELATRALNQNCNDTESREILGLSQYVKWATTTGPQSDEALNQARLFLPPGPKVFDGLAASDHSLIAARKLIAAGEDVDERDNEKMDALAYALQGHDMAVVTRLLKLGARPSVPVGDDAVPAALLPVMIRNLDAIRTLREHGVKYSSISYRGVTAMDMARRSGDPALLAALGERHGQL
jgi:tetratricopeptide (TPR) repeat protein